MGIYDEWKQQHDYDKLVIAKWREEHVLPVGTRVRANTDIWDEHNGIFLVDVNTKGTITEVSGTDMFPDYFVKFDGHKDELWVYYAHDLMDMNEIDVVSKPKSVAEQRQKPEQMRLFSS